MALSETARLVAELELKDNFSRGINSALGSVGRLESGLGRMGRGAGQVAGGLERLGTRAALAAAGGLAAVVSTAASFEQAFTGIEKTVDETANTTFPELEEAIRSMARSIPVSFEELSRIGEAGGALGIAADDLEDFIDVVARLGVSTDLSTDAAATALGQLGNVLHLRGDDFRDFADSLVALGNAGASTESQIVEIAARFGAAGNAAGLTKEEILALSSATASMGIQQEAAGGSLSRLFNSVATNIGTASDKAQAFAKTLGLSAREFRDAWERDALGTFQDFLAELGKLDQFAQARVLADIGLTNTRDVNAVRLMAQNIELVNEQLAISTGATDELNEESQKFFDTAIGQWQILKNNVRDAGVTIGNELLPVFVELGEELTDFLDDPKTRAALKSFGQDLAGTIRDVVAELRGADWSGFIEGMKLAGQVAKAAFDAFHSLPPQVQALAVTAIALNKVSGGAIGQIARGLGNIGGGLISMLPGRAGAVGGLLAGRGNSPLAPLFVTVVGAIPGLTGGLPGLGGGRIPFGTPTFGGGGQVVGPGGLPRNLLTGLKFILPAAIGYALVDGLLNTIDPLGTGQRVRGATFPKTQDVNVVNRADVFDEDAFREAKAGRLLQASELAAIKTLEQRLIRDPSFQREITSPAQFLRLLRRTSEFGQRGVGTAIEQGPTTGRDPTGRAFVALVRRLDEKTLKSVAVQGEIRRHIAAARSLIGTGNDRQDRKLQSTIDTLRQILSSTKDGNRKQDDARRAIDNTSSKTQGILREVVGETRATKTTIANKNFSPRIAVSAYTTVNTSVSVSDVIRSVTTARFAESTKGSNLLGVIG